MADQSKLKMITFDVYFDVYFLSKTMKTETSAVTSIILETRKQKKEVVQDNESPRHPVKLRVTFQGKRKYYTLNDPAKRTIYMTQDEFNRALNDPKPKEPYKTLKIHLSSLEQRAIAIIRDMPEFTFDVFESSYFTLRDKSDLLVELNAAAERLRQEKRISTAVSYECTAKSLAEFTGKSELLFKSVTVSFLKKYQNWMLTPRVIKWQTKAGKEKTRLHTNSLTTVGIYLRNVRTMFNESKIKGLVYPFGKPKNGLYQIPKGRNTKKALTLEQVGMIAAYRAITGTTEQRCRDLWLFSYMCNGINMKDVCRLKYSDIVRDAAGDAKITLIRAKTAESVEERQPIEIMITRQIGRIIDRWGNKPAKPDQYIFPILQKEMTPVEEYDTVKQLVKTINKNMKRICKHLEIDPVTTYTARHSFATVLKRSGASVEFISESLGHRNISTTQGYLSSFEDKLKREYAEKLLPDMMEDDL